LPLIRRLSRIKVTTGREPTFEMTRIVKIPLPAGQRRRRPRRAPQLNRLDRIVQQFLSRCKETPAKSTNRRRLELGRRSIRHNRNCNAIPVLLSPALRAHTSNVNIYIYVCIYNKILFHEHHRQESYRDPGSSSLPAASASRMASCGPTIHLPGIATLVI